MPPLEHIAEKCGRFSDDIMLQLLNLEQDSNSKPNPALESSCSGESRTSYLSRYSALDHSPSFQEIADAPHPPRCGAFLMSFGLLLRPASAGVR
ncbi:hypothetical protein B5K03_21135 [Rhizobium phaseoli]|nr:hypothetical protein B5K03_21135 [Rhizobium phaseoli]